MKKKIVIIICIVLVCIIVASLVIVSKHEKKASVTANGNLRQRVILFYSHQCPHCLKVEEFIKRENVGKTVSFEQKDVLKGHENVKLLMSVVSKCKLKTNAIPIPMLWTGQKCLSGVGDVENYFRERMHEKARDE